MTNIWFTSDLHLGHTNIIKYCKRPFKNIEEMDTILIDNWNNNIDKKDIVYFLGDLCFGNIDKYIKKLNGKIHFIKGSHDYISDNKLILYSNIEFVSNLKCIYIEKQPIVLCHWAMRTWHKKMYGSWHLFGHSHGNISPWGKSFDIGVDCHNFKPWNYDEIIDFQKILKQNESDEPSKNK